MMFESKYIKRERRKAQKSYVPTTIWGYSCWGYSCWNI